MYLLMIISGVMMGLCFTMDKLDLLAWIALVPFFYVLFHKDFNKKKPYKLGFCYGFSFYIVLMQWLIRLYPLEWIGFNKLESIVIIGLGWILFSLFLALIIALVPFIFSKVKNDNDYLNIISVAFIWVIIEGFQGIGSLGFTWGRIAMSQGDMIYLIQGANLFGSLFVSFLIVIVNGIICNIFISCKEQRITKAKKAAIILSIIMILNVTYGIANVKSTIAGREINVSIVQGNISFDQKWVDGKYDILNKYKKLTDKAIMDWNQNGQKVDLLIWPETAIPVSVNQERTILNEYFDIANKNKLILAVGGFYTEESEDGSTEYNSVYTIEDRNYNEPLYSKRKLVPFGEYIPFSNVLTKVIPKLQQLNIEGSLIPGDGTYIGNTSVGKLGYLICYESIFPNLARQSVNDGAEVILIVTNDSWFKDSIALEQHKKQAVFRAIENNKYVVRAANTGISTIINSNGQIEDEIPIIEANYLNGKVKLNSDFTFYNKVGDIIIIIGILYLIGLWVKFRYKINQ